MLLLISVTDTAPKGWVGFYIIDRPNQEISASNSVSSARAGNPNS